MTDSPTGQDVAGIVVQTLTGEVAPTTAAAAAQAIAAWHETSRTLGALIQAKVMESCWVIQREHSGREGFELFAGRHLAGILEPDRAWLLAETWGAARTNRGLRELATTDSAAAIGFVEGFVDAGMTDRLDQLDDADKRLVEFATAAPAKRLSMMRELLASDQAARQGRHPEDVQAIGRLTAERDQYRDRAYGRAPAGDEVREVIGDLHRIERELATIADRLPETIPGADDGLRQRLLAATDSVIARIDAISGQALTVDGS